MITLTEGYIYNSYGKIDFLKYVFASVVTIRRYDKTRKIALYCSKDQKTFIEENGLTHWFDVLNILDDPYQSITGFKHNLHLFCPFDHNLFIDSDILWLKNPDQMWGILANFGFAVTGLEVADSYFGAPKNLKVIVDILLQRRKKTLHKFGLTQLSRVQSGVMFVKDVNLAKEINEKATYFFKNMNQTHFQSRLKEKGRNEESCEWSLGMALSYFKISVFPWFWSENSIQLDFIDDYTKYDENFERVACLFYFNPFIYSFRGLKNKLLRTFLHKLFSYFPGKNDYAWVTPYCLHFGWFHQKEPFKRFADKIWIDILKK
jgi:D-ribose pyranose/furanose isomerase RbsD